jgi:hypothetical protein
VGGREEESRRGWEQVWVLRLGFVDLGLEGRLVGVWFRSDHAILL